MSHSRPSSSFGPVSVVATTKTFLDRLSTHIFGIGSVDVDGTVYPRDAFTSYYNQLYYEPRDASLVWMSPLWCAALQGSDIVIRLLATISEKLGLQDELGRALFFAIRHGHQQTVDALLGLGANPGREMISNGLHGAASRGWKDEMCYYVKEYNVSVDIPDESFMTPVMYVIAGVPPPYDSDAIDCLFELGADTTAAIGDYGWTYTEYALAMGKKDLSRRLTTVAEAELDRQRHAAAATKAKLDRRRRRAAAKRDLTLPFEAAAAYPGSPTILNSSRESSCTVGRDNE